MGTELDTVSDNVRRLMAAEPECRNSDRYLIYRYACLYCGVNIDWDTWRKLPHFESIRRVRQKIQSEGFLLPTEQEVKEKRGLLEKEFREFSRK